MKKIMMCFCVLALSVAAYGKPVDANTAQNVAYNFYKPKANLQGQADLSLVYTSTSVVNGASVVGFYVFNAVSGQGFVIISGDDNVMPVLGYSTESNFTTGKLNPSVQYLLTNYQNQVAYAIQNNTRPQAQISEKWNNLKSNNQTTRSAARTTDTAVGPLLISKWDQENPDAMTPYTYNADCPYDSLAATPGKTLTGCVATAMAQVMKYWNWPDTGVGSHTYTQTPNPDNIPAQTANFAIAYHFDSMKTPYITTPNTYVAKLMYNAGVSVNMQYGTDAEDGSGAYVTIAYTPPGVTYCAEYALVNFWRYPTAKGYKRGHTAEALWLDSMFNELNSRRPVIYAGSGNEGGHCWVMDGYDNDSFFHFNWGWSGSFNGYYTLSNLTPDDDTFNSSQEAIIRIVADTPANYSADTSTKVKTAVAQVTTPGSSIRVFPNPASNAVNVSFEGVPVTEIMITDIEGRTVQQLSVSGSAGKVTLPVSDLPNGMYLLRLQTDQGILTRKFVVAK